MLKNSKLLIPIKYLSKVTSAVFLYNTKKYVFLKIKKLLNFLRSLKNNFILNYACPAGPKFNGIAGCSTSFISP